MKSEKRQIKESDFIEWDTENWTKAIPYWESFVNLNSVQPLKCLELGARNGGLSLWLALKGHYVICSDLENPEESSKRLHCKYPGLQNISYEAINATSIPYKCYFDIVIFKSILGGIGQSGNVQAIEKVIDEIYNSLKPGGIVMFAENLIATKLHQFLRKNLTRWGNYWTYLTIEEYQGLFKKFNNLTYNTAGFLGAFGRNESQRKLLGKIDTMLMERLVSKKMRYVIFGLATKP